MRFFNRRLLIAASFFLIFSAFLWAQNPGTASLRGVVRDPSQLAISRATITLASRDTGREASAVSELNGQYRFEHVLPGAYWISANAEGFETSTPQPVEMKPGAALSIDLRLEIAAVKTTVSVTATGTAQHIDEMAKALSTVDTGTADLLDRPTVASALMWVPGLRIQQLGGPGSLVSIKARGLRNQDTAVLIDGDRLRDAASTQGDGSALLGDLLVVNLDRVEVLRGAGSSIYGTNAVGGVVNLITAPGGTGTHGELLTEGGSLGTFRGRAGLNGDLWSQRLNYSLGVAHLNVTEGVTGFDGARSSSVLSRFGVVASRQVRFDGRVFVTDSFSRITGNPEVMGSIPASGIVDAVPDANFRPNYSNPDNTQAQRMYSGALKMSARFSDDLGVTIGYQGMASHRRYGDGPAGSGYQPMGNTRSDYDGEIHTLNGRFDGRIGRYQSIDAGYEFENERYGNWNVSPNPLDTARVDVTQRSHVVFAQDQVHLLDGRLEIAGSYRAQFFTLRNPLLTPANSAPYAGMKFDAPPTAQTGDGSAAWFFRGSGTKIRAHVGKGYRAPSLYERFGTYYSQWGYSAYGDPRLQPDRSISVDGGVDQTWWNGRARMSATYFYTRLQQVVVYDSSGAILPATDPYGRYGGYRNTSGGLARGVEWSGVVSPARTLNLTGAYTYTNAREKRPLVGDILRTFAIPEHQFAATVIEQVTPRLTLSSGLVFASNYLAPMFDPSTYATRAYRFDGMRRVQVGINYRIPLGERISVRLFANGDNLLNQEYFENGYQTPRATGMGGLRLEF